MDLKLEFHNRVSPVFYILPGLYQTCMCLLWWWTADIEIYQTGMCLLWCRTAGIEIYRPRPSCSTAFVIIACLLLSSGNVVTYTVQTMRSDAPVCDPYSSKNEVWCSCMWSIQSQQWGVILLLVTHTVQTMRCNTPACDLYSSNNEVWCSCLWPIQFKQWDVMLLLVTYTVQTMRCNTPACYLYSSNTGTE